MKKLIRDHCKKEFEYNLPKNLDSAIANLNIESDLCSKCSRMLVKYIEKFTGENLLGDY